LYASVNVACTSFCVSPNHLLCSVLGRTLMKHAPDCRASACAPPARPGFGGALPAHGGRRQGQRVGQSAAGPRHRHRARRRGPGRAPWPAWSSPCPAARTAARPWPGAAATWRTGAAAAAARSPHCTARRAAPPVTRPTAARVQQRGAGPAARARTSVLFMLSRPPMSSRETSMTAGLTTSCASTCGAGTPRRSSRPPPRGGAAAPRGLLRCLRRTTSSAEQHRDSLAQQGCASGKAHVLVAVGHNGLANPALDVLLLGQGLRGQRRSWADRAERAKE